MTRPLGAILAGGEGRRMGGRKEEVLFRGRPLWAHAWNALAPVTGPGILLQGRDRAPEGLEPSPDRRTGQGPLAGIETALHRAGGQGLPGVVVTAVDLPRVPASLVVGLLRRWRQSPEADVHAVVVRDGERVQPLLGVYGAGLAPVLTDWLDGRPERAAHAWIDALGDRVWRLRPEELQGAVGHDEPLANLNRPEDVEVARRLAPPAPPLVAVAGWKDSGKTSTAATLIRALTARGRRVMALKHGHRFRFDTEGTDSARMRASGAERVVLAGPEELGLVGDWGRDGEAEPTALSARYLSEADVVVVEGWKGAPLPTIEVLVPARGDDPPLWSPDGPDRDRFLARVVPGGTPGVGGGGTAPPVFDRDAPGLGELLADVVEARVIPGWRP